MATTKTDAQKVTELRKQAQDKSLPQEVRDMADKKANDIEGKSVKKATGMELAKGGAVVAKAPMKKPAAKKTAAKSPALVIAVGVGKPKGKAMMNKGGMSKKGC